MFIAMLLKNWQFVVIGLLSAALAGSGIYIKVLKSDVTALNAEKSSLIVKLEVSTSSITALQSAIGEQNAAVEKFKAEADAREKANRNEAIKAKVESANQKKRADDLMARVIPQNTTACNAANQLFNEEIKSAK